VIRLTPAKADRISAVALPLTASYSQAAGVPVVVRVADQHVVAVECPAATSLADRMCGARDAETNAWTVTLPVTSQRPVVYLLADRAP